MKKENFLPQLSGEYVYEVLGGLHTLKAKQELAKEYPDQPAYSTCSGLIYCNLSDEESLRLASRHNINGHFNHMMVHQDYVEACRARLFVMANRDPHADPTPPVTLVWKKACKICILPSDISATRADNIFKQASMDKEIFSLALKCMSLYKDGQLKDQKIRKVQKTPEFKQHHLESLHNLDLTIQKQLLEEVCRGGLFLTDLKVKCKEHRDLDNAKRLFTKCVNKKTWEEAKTSFPFHADEERLKPFLALSLKGKVVPQAFRDFCQAALDAQEGLKNRTSITRKGCSTHFIEGDIRSVSVHQIKKHVDNFRGVHLFVAHIGEELSEDVLATMVLSAKAYNGTTTALQSYTFVALCPSLSPAAVVKMAEAVFTNLDGGYFLHMCCMQKEPNRGMVADVVMGFVGHWSQSESGVEPKKPYSGNGLVVPAGRSPWERVIEEYSTEGQTIMILKDSPDLGQISSKALELRRSSIVFYEDAEALQEMEVHTLLSTQNLDDQ